MKLFIKPPSQHPELGILVARKLSLVFSTPIPHCVWCVCVCVLYFCFHSFLVVLPYISVSFIVSLRPRSFLYLIYSSSVIFTSTSSSVSEYVLLTFIVMASCAFLINAATFCLNVLLLNNLLLWIQMARPFMEKESESKDQIKALFK